MTLTTTIVIDENKTGPVGSPGWNGTLGHELIHAINCRRKARSLDRGPRDFDGVFDCLVFAQGIIREFGHWWVDETQHANPDSPLPGVDYPVDYDNEDVPIDIPIFPVAIPSTGFSV